MTGEDRCDNEVSIIIFPGQLLLLLLLLLLRFRCMYTPVLRPGHDTFVNPNGFISAAGRQQRPVTVPGHALHLHTNPKP